MSQWEYAEGGRAMAALLATLAVFVAGFLAFRIEGRLRPRPMAVRLERFFLANPLRRRFFGPDRVLRALGDIRALSVLEVGVGAGVVAEALARSAGRDGEFLGIDIQPAAVAMTRARLRDVACRWAIQAGDARKLPWPAARVDRLVMVAMLGEIPPPDRPAALREAYRVLKPSGRLVVTEFWPDPHYIARRQLAVLLTRAGFVEEAHYAGFFGYSVRAKKTDGL